MTVQEIIQALRVCDWFGDGCTGDCPMQQREEHCFPFLLRLAAAHLERLAGADEAELVARAKLDVAKYEYTELEKDTLNLRDALMKASRERDDATGLLDKAGDAENDRVIEQLRVCNDSLTRNLRALHEDNLVMAKELADAQERLKKTDHDVRISERLAEQVAYLEKEANEWKALAHKHLAERDKALRKKERAEAAKRQLLADVQEIRCYGGECKTCKHHCQHTDIGCERCGKAGNCPCMNCSDEGDRWVWRGLNDSAPDPKAK